VVEDREMRVLLTGAAGKVGIETRAFLAQRCRLRSTDVRELVPSSEDEAVECDLSDIASTQAIVNDMDAVVHLAAIPRDEDIQEIARANIISTWNVFDAAKKARVKRIVFASSNHAIGFYSPEEHLDTLVLPRPDGIYGASKVFGESVGRLFWDKHGLECVCLRIGSVLDKPTELRHLSTWISPRDLNQLIWCSLSTPAVGFTIAYGMSNNARAWWSNDGTRVQGYLPQDRSEDYAPDLLANALDATSEPRPERFQGGRWAEAGYEAGSR
jgi:uronate dehydrogenase